MALLKAAGLSYRIKDREILSDISFELDSGEYLGLIGPNGSGKSTLLKLLSGQIRPSSGAITVDGRNILDMPVRERSKLMAYMPQIVSAENLRNFSVREIVRMGRFPFHERFRSFSADDRLAVDAAIEEMELACLAERDVTSLSGGEFQRALLASVIAQGSPLILLDESFSFLDMRHRMDLEMRLKKLLSRGRAIIYVFHQFDESLHTKTSLLALKDGKLFFNGSVNSFMFKNRPGRLFDMRFKKVRMGKKNILLPVMRK